MAKDESSDNDNPYLKDDEEKKEKEPGPLPVWPKQ